MAKELSATQACWNEWDRIVREYLTQVRQNHSFKHVFTVAAVIAMGFAFGAILSYFRGLPGSTFFLSICFLFTSVVILFFYQSSGSGLIRLREFHGVMPDGVLQMIADSSVLPNSLKAELAKAIAADGTVPARTMMVWLDLYGEAEARAAARRAPGAKKLLDNQASMAAKLIQCISVKSAINEPIIGPISEFEKLCGCLFGDLDIDETVTVSFTKMTRQQIDELPEFDG